MTSQSQSLEEGQECRVQMISVPATDEEPSHVMIFVEAVSSERCQLEVSRLMEAQGVVESHFQNPHVSVKGTWCAYGYVRSAE